MAVTNDTKAKLLRGVVQDNVDIVQGVRTKRAIKRKLSLRYWFSAGIGLAGIAYVAIPSQVVSTANTSRHRSDRHGFSCQHRANAGVCGAARFAPAVG